MEIIKIRFENLIRNLLIPNSSLKSLKNDVVTASTLLYFYATWRDVIARDVTRCEHSKM